MSNIKRRFLTMLLSLAMIITYMPVSMITSYAAAGDTPDHDKLLQVNDDGTYTIAMNVTGDSEKKINKTNIIMILDASNSMYSNNTGQQEVTYTPTTSTSNGLYGLIDGNYVPLERRGNGGNRTFWYNGVQYTGQRYERSVSNQTRMEATLDSMEGVAETLLDYNKKAGNPSDTVEMGLIVFSGSTQTAIELNPTTDYETFETEAETWRPNHPDNHGTSWHSALNLVDDVNFNDDDPTYVIFFTDGAPTTDGDYQTQPEYEASLPIARDIVQNQKYTLYSIFAFGNGQNYLRQLTNYAYTGTESTADSDYFYNATDGAELAAAFAEILAKIEMAGIGSVSMSDGTTSSVETSSGEISNLLTVDTSSYKYYRAGGKKDDGTEKYDSDKNTITYKDTDGVEHTDNVGEEWADAPAAEFKDGAVNWNLGENVVLEDDVKYTVTFDCWPSQTTLDIVADIKNDPAAWDKLDPEIQKYIDRNGNLSTNTTATLSYVDTRTGQSGSSTYVNPDPVASQAVEQVAISKEWENDLDGQGKQEVELGVMRGTETEPHYTVTLNDGNQWKGSVYISIGIMRTNEETGEVEVLEGAEGHDFTFTEPEDLSYHWEIDVPVMHPMMIDGTLTMLIKEDAKHTPSAGAKEYTIGGAKYYADDAAVSLTATNYRRSSLLLTKEVTGTGAPEDAIFPFTLNIDNALAPETEPSASEDPNHDSDWWVWISVRDKDGNRINDAVTEGATPSGQNNGWYYGVSGRDIKLNVKAGYSIRINNLPTDSEYTFTEGTLPTGFSYSSTELKITDNDGNVKEDVTDPDFVGDRTTEGTITGNNALFNVKYSNEYTLTDVSVSKVWDDAGDQDGLRPEDADFALTLNGLPAGETAPTPTMTKSADGNTWTYTWAGLPKYDDNKQEIQYSVTEETVPEGYTCAQTTAQPGGIITNVHAPATVDVPVEKVWEDESDQDGIRPDSVTVQLYKYKKTAGEASKTVVTDKTLTLSGTSWAGTFEGLPQYEDGEELAYTVVETPVPEGYSAEVTSSADGLVVTNTHVPGKVSKTVTKVWDDSENQDGIRPDSVEIVLTGSNNTTYSVTLNGTADAEPSGTAAAGYESAPWVATFVNLPEKASGSTITYTPSETTTTVITGTDKAGEYAYSWDDGKTTVTNKHTPETTEATVKKVWDDGEDQDGKRPAKLVVTLKNGNTTVETVTLTSQNNWTATVSGLPKYADGQEITYTWEEDESSLPEGYSLKSSTTSDAVTTITNTYTPETTEATVKKVWDDDRDRDGKRPASLDVALKNGSTTVDTVTLSAQNNWTATLSGLPKNSGGQPITYTWEESSMPEGYALQSTSTDGTVTTLTNHYDTEKTTVSVNKVWEDGNNQDGKRPDSVTVQLFADGKAYGSPVTLNDQNQWKYTWSDLNVYPEAPEEEAAGDDSNTAAADDSDQTQTQTGETAPAAEDQTNAAAPPAQKSSKNDAAAAETPAQEPAAEQVQEEEPAAEEAGNNDAEANASDSKAEEALSAEESEPEAAEETADAEKPAEETKEETVPSEETKATDSQDENDSAVTKPAENKVTIKAKAAELDAAASDEDSTESEKTKIEYTVEEVNVPEGYEAEVSGEATSGFTITNTHTPETTVAEVKKVWDDNNDADGKRPSELKVTLSSGDEVTLNEGNSWTAKVEGLPKYKDGQEIKYTWSEAGMPEGYSLESSETSGTVTTLTNKYTAPDKGTVYIDPPVQKIIKGTAPKKAETYTFKLEATNASYPMPEEAGGSSSMTVDIKGEGIREFGVIEFTEPGVYSYIVSEELGDNEDCEYDDTIYTVIATVTEGSDGKLQVEREYRKDGVSVDTATFQFVNTYTGSSNGVKTGDESGLAGWLALLLLAGAGAGYIAYSRRRREDNTAE